MKALSFLVLLISLFVSISYVSAAQNETMTVEVNVVVEEEIVSIEVPDYLFMENISAGESTDKFRIDVNNTGNVDISVTPLLQDSNEEIFSYLYFQNRQSGNYSQEYLIGNYSFDIDKPSSPGGKRSEYCWMWLDLSDFNGEIGQNRIETTDILFVALPKIN